MKPKIGLVGVGKMGSNLGRRLRDRGYPIAAVYDVVPGLAAEVARELGGEAVDRLARVTELSEVILTVVSDDAAMRSIYAERGDSLFQGAAGKLFLNLATISPAVHREIELLSRRENIQADVLESPMASSITQAREGTLYLMCAGRPEIYQRAEPLLQEIGAARRYIGASGTAAQLKLLVNMVMNINTAGLAEGLGLAEALGLDLALVQEVFAQTGAASRVLQTDGNDMAQREHEPFFTAAHAAKDAGLALDLAVPVGLNLPLARATQEQYKRMIARGLGGLDKSGVSELTFPCRGASA